MARSISRDPLNEIADGAWGDGPMVRGAARDLIRAAARGITTVYFRVPGPAPECDWTAFYDGAEETGPYGSGATEQAAINDLVQNYEAP